MLRLAVALIPFSAVFAMMIVLVHDESSHADFDKANKAFYRSRIVHDALAMQIAIDDEKRAICSRWWTTYSDCPGQPPLDTQ